MGKNKIDEATGGYYDPGYEGLDKGGIKTALVGLALLVLLSG